MTVLIQYGDGPRAIYDSLRLRILSGELSTGQELKIQAMAEEYGVSIMPVREAVRMLAAEDLIELRPRRSPVVTSPDLADILEINDIRLALEPIALSEAIPRHTRETLAACRRIIAEDKRCDDRWHKVELNRKFHIALLAPSGKKRVMQVIEAQYSAIALLAQFLVVQSTAVMGEPHSEHELILDAVEKKNEALALERLRDHLLQSNERVMSVLAHHEAEPV